MRHGLGLVLIMLALLTPLTIMAGGLNRSPASGTDESAAVPLSPVSPKPLMLADAALADAREILSADNSCSRFFGGTAEVMDVLDGLSGRIRLQRLPDRLVGIRMTGGEATFISHLTGYEYRLFREVIINTNGPFYSSGNAFSPMPRCGSFWPNTREARVLMLLHELGHMIKGANGKWLLPDDGGNDRKSLSNTRIIEAKCLPQIKALESPEGLAGKLEDRARDQE
ncbi:MAG TPA: hypothetical protein VF553_00115 [Pyrinomonadaceae bacterium]